MPTTRDRDARRTVDVDVLPKRYDVARSLTSPRLSTAERHELAVLEALVAEGGEFDLSDHQLQDLRDLRNRAEGSDRWELEQYRGNGDWYLVDSVARMESEAIAGEECWRTESAWHDEVLHSARELVRRDLDLAAIAIEIQRDHHGKLPALGCDCPEGIPSFILAAAWELYLEAHVSQSTAVAEAWARLERVAGGIGALFRPGPVRIWDAWPFFTVEPEHSRPLTTFADLERLAAERPEALMPYQAGALACLRNAAYQVPGRWRAEPVSERAFRLTLVG